MEIKPQTVSPKRADHQEPMGSTTLQVWTNNESSGRDVKGISNWKVIARNRNNWKHCGCQIDHSKSFMELVSMHCNITENWSSITTKSVLFPEIKRKLKKNYDNKYLRKIEPIRWEHSCFHTNYSILFTDKIQLYVKVKQSWRNWSVISSVYYRATDNK